MLQDFFWLPSEEFTSPRHRCVPTWNCQDRHGGVVKPALLPEDPDIDLARFWLFCVSHNNRSPTSVLALPHAIIRLPCRGIGVQAVGIGDTDRRVGGGEPRQGFHVTPLLLCIRGQQLLDSYAVGFEFPITDNQR